MARRVLLPAAAWLLSLAAFLAALLRPAPLFLNLGAGDEAFARGFRSGWERDGLQGSGETTFRWTLDGARLTLPLALRSASATARVRLARFSDTPVDVQVWQGERKVDEWRQPPRGWRVRDIALGALQGPLDLRVRSQSAGGDEMGLALDWVEIAGVGALRPDGPALLRLLLFLFGLPLACGVLLRRADAVAWSGAALATLAAAAVALDRLGGLLAVTRAAGPLLAVLIALAAAAALLARLWPAALTLWPAALVPAALAALALTALSQPFFYYPDVDTHARFVEAIARQPALLADARPYQERTGAWTREVAGQRVAFPYSPVFHLLAEPPAALWGATTAVKALGVFCAALAVLLAHALARALGLGPRGALAAQAIVAALPVMASRLTLALYPTLLGQALELLLVVFLARALDDSAPRAAVGAFGLMLAAQLAYTGSVVNVSALALVLASMLLAAGRGASARRLLIAWAAALAVVLLVLYARFLPIVFGLVLPHLRDVPAEGGGGTAFASVPLRALVRLHVFYDTVFPLLAALGFYVLRGAPAAARRVLGAALAAALLLLGLRFVAPALLRDAKEVELLAAPVAVCSAAALGLLWRRGGGARLLAVAAAVVGAAWCVTRAVAFYAERFTAVGR